MLSEQKVEKQPFIPYVEEREYPEMLKPILYPYVRRMGFLPNALRAPIEAYLAGEAAYVERPEV
jgi:hypothetical protein